MTDSNDKPPFVATQGIQLLLETDRPQRFLRAEYFRAGRGAMGGAPQGDPGRWITVDRFDLALNRVGEQNDQLLDLSRVAITTDAGVGKTTTLEWLEAVLNRPGSDELAFLLTFSELPGGVDQLIPDCLVPRFHASGAAGLGKSEVASVLQYLRDQGRLVLLFDALDQAPGDGAGVHLLAALADHAQWQSCRIVVSGRPYALQRYWGELFQPLVTKWRFVKLDEFDEGQQRDFLGEDEQGESRLDRLPSEAREILSTPRVLSYLRQLPSKELSAIRTASDVYWRATEHLLRTGLSGSRDARRIGLAVDEEVPSSLNRRSLRQARKLLAAIAFEMTSQQVTRPKTDDAPMKTAPNFDRVPPGEFDKFADGLEMRVSAARDETSRRLLERDIDGLAALNDFLGHGIFDTDVVGLDRILWRNRSLQEFYTALWLARYAETADTQRLWDWVYLSHDPATEEYYWVWRYLCEMPDDALEPVAWAGSIEPVFRPGNGTAEGTKRPSEMIYRAWDRLESLVEKGEETARRVQERFLGEFELLLSGRREPAEQETAQQFCNSFLGILAGEFLMGAPEEKQGLPPDERERWEAFLNELGDPQARARELVDGWNLPPGKQGEELRQFHLQRWERLFQNRSIDEMVEELWPKNETPSERVHKIDKFQMSRYPTLNAWFRLYDPGHGIRAAWFRESLREISPESASPVIYVCWYDAWAFCKWACWDGQSCRLPYEDEWEYAAKSGTSWEQSYWWGDEFLSDTATRNRE